LLWRAARAEWRKWGGALAVSAGAVFGLAAGITVPAGALAKGLEQSAGVVALSALPVQAQETHRLILSGGPFPHDKDGVVFGNRERQLPRKSRGYYREYTVKTPGSHNRGARRIVCGGEPPTQPEVCYYTADHYATFSRIAR
jgi:ribonuclease T1